MLYSFDTSSKVGKVPHEQEYRTWLGRMTAEEIETIRAEIERRIDGKEIDTSSWIPGNDWSGTPFMPIYEKACLLNEEQAAMCFGLMLWETLMEREEWWGFGRYSLGGVDIGGMTYFRIAEPTL